MKAICVGLAFALTGCAGDSPERQGGTTDTQVISFPEIPTSDSIAEVEARSDTTEVFSDTFEPPPDLSDTSPEDAEDLSDFKTETSELADVPDDIGPSDTPDEPADSSDTSNASDAHEVDISGTCGDGTCDPTENCLSCPDCECPFHCGADILISEYLEGTSWNKALEIANFTGLEVDLEGYFLWKITNGGGWSEASPFPLTGRLAHGEVIVLCHELSLPGILSRCDLPSDSGTFEFNGDDAVALVKDDIIIDLIGEEGPDPGVGWSVGSTEDATAEHTLRRRPERVDGSPDWAQEAQTWQVLDRDLVADLGAHSFAARCEREVEPDPICGDDECNGLETCASCSEDCGVCGPSAGDLVITEVNFDANWFEVISVADHALDLSLLELRGSLDEGTGTFEKAELLAPLTLIGPGDALVFGAGPEPFLDVPYTGFSLDPSTDVIEFFQGGAYSQTIDRLAWDAPMVEGPAWSLSFTATDADMNDSSSAWCNADPSPGIANATCPRCGDLACNGLETCETCASDCGACPIYACASDLFLSEYVEGSSNNKALEIANFTGVDVDLGSYAIWKITNGAGTGWEGAKKVALSGILRHGETFVFCHAASSTAVLERCDLVSISTTVTAIDFNGDDAVGLAGAGVLIDAIGQEGPDPGTAWPVGDTPLGTLDHTLRRRAGVLGPNPTWGSAATEWEVLETDEFSGLGDHQSGLICSP